MDEYTSTASNYPEKKQECTNNSCVVNEVESVDSNGEFEKVNEEPAVVEPVNKKMYRVYPSTWCNTFDLIVILLYIVVGLFLNMQTGFNDANGMCPAIAYNST